MVELNDGQLLEEIRKLELSARQYQQEVSITSMCHLKLQSKYVEAIGIIEELLKIKKVNYGTASKEFSRSCK